MVADMMPRWMIRLGYCLLVIGIVSLSPAPDLLPVETWGWLRSIFGESESPLYYRTVPAEDAWPAVWAMALVLTGLLLILYGKFIGRTRGKTRSSI